MNTNGTRIVFDDVAKEFFERIATGIERLAEDPVVNLETTIPVCPHCNTNDPVVMVKESEGAGKLGEIVFQVTCGKCHNGFIIIPFQSFYAKTIQEATDFQQEREMVYERAGNNEH